MTPTLALAFVRFETPGYLVFLAVLPLVWLAARRSLAGIGPIRGVLALALRAAVVLCIVLALAGAMRVRTTDDLTVIFVVDRSRSIPRAMEDASFAFVRAAAQGLRPGKDSMGVVAFDGRASVEQLPLHELGIDYVGSPGAPDQTNIAAALRMAAALFTDDVIRRVVVLSDGNQNVGDALTEADQFAAAGVPLDVFPLQYEHGDEVVFERLATPPRAALDETVKLQMVLHASRGAAGRVLVYHNEELLDLDPDSPQAGFPVQLDQGYTRLEVPVPLRTRGVHRFRAVFEPQESSADSIAANNEGRAFTIVSSQGRILVLTQANEEGRGGDEESAVILAEALRREKLEVDVEIVGQQPLDQVRLLEYSAVVLSNVPANLVAPEERQALAVYVRDLGGGLVMIGGDNSLGAGGWMGTPVEEVMPVSFDVKSKKQIPKGALVLVMHASEVPQGNFIGERAAISAVRTLSSRDLVGVMAWDWQGTSDSQWVVPLQEVGDKAGVIQQIRRMSMGDLPDLDPLVSMAADALIARPDAATKHMIIVSDFDPQAPRTATIEKLQQARISVSTVTIGFGGHWVDTGKARQIAQETGGKDYTTQDFSKVPQIFIKESRIVRRSLINETPFEPQRAPAISTVLAGLGQERLPRLGGLVLSTPKPLAQVPLVRTGEEGDADPLLAHWQVGLGKTVAFASGLWTRWGAAWVSWPGFSKLWAQTLRWASRPSASSAFDVTTSVQGGRGRIQIDALDKNAAAVNFMNIAGVMVDPQQKSSPLALTQTGPGRYEGEFDARLPGSYIFNLNYATGRGELEQSGTLQTGVSVAFSPEYRELQPNEALLRELTQRTRGRLLDSSMAGLVFDRAGLDPAERRTPVWDLLLRLTLALFLLDVAVRRIAVNPIELARRVRRRLSELAGRRQPGDASAAVLTTLKGSRERAREALPSSGAAGEAGPAPTRSARYAPPADAKAATQELEKALGGAAELDQPVVARPPRKPAAAGEADMTARLLRAKRAAREKIDQEDGDSRKQT